MKKLYSTIIALSILGVSIIILSGCTKKFPNIPSYSLDKYPGITSFMGEISKKSLLLAGWWESVRSTRMPLLHAREVKFYKRVKKGGYTVNTIEGITENDTIILSYWAYGENDTLYGFVNISSGIGSNNMEVKLFVDSQGRTVEVGKIIGLQDTVVYNGTMINDSILDVEWEYLPSDTNFSGRVNLQEQVPTELIYQVTQYITSTNFVNRSIIPIPIEIVETMAENVENSKMDPNMVSTIGSIGLGLWLGLIYPPSMWYIGFAGSSVYALINTYINGHRPS